MATSSLAMPPSAAPETSTAPGSPASARERRAQKRSRSGTAASLSEMANDGDSFPDLTSGVSHELVMELEASNMELHLDEEHDDNHVGGYGDDDDCNDDEEDDGMDDMLEMEEERIMQMEEEGITDGTQIEMEEEGGTVEEDDDHSASTNQQLTEFMRGRARTMSIDIEKLTAGFDMDDMPNIPLDSFIGGSLAGDDSSVLASELPPLILNKLLSRSRSNSVATQGGRERGGSLDGILPTIVTSSSTTAPHGKTGTTVTFAQLGDSSSGARDRTFSFEFFSFGNSTECPLPVPSATEAIHANGNIYSGKIDDDTPLIKNGKKRARSRAGSMCAPMSPRTRTRSGSLSLTLSPSISIASSTRPRGDSIIFDPTSFSDGGIHEQHALQMPTIPVTDKADIKKVNDGTKAAESAGLSPRSATATPITSTSLAPPSQVAKATSTSEPTKDRILRQTTVIVPKSVNSIKSSVGAIPKPVLRRPYTLTPAVVAPVRPMPIPVPSLPPMRSMPALTSKTTAPLLYPPKPPVSSMPAYTSKISNANSGLSNNGAEALTVPSCITSGITFTMEILNKDGRIGIYLPEERRARLEKFHSKRKMRIWRKRIKYDCRKKLADSRPRIKGRFVRRSDVDED